MRMKWSGLLSALAVAAVLGGCSTNPNAASSPQPDAQPVQGQAFTVQVTNSMSMPMNISYTYGGQSVTALGQVPAGQTMSFTVPNRGGDNLEVLAGDANGNIVTRKKLDMESGSVVSITLK